MRVRSAGSPVALGPPAATTPPVAARSAQLLAQDEPLPDRERLRAPVRVDPGGRERRGHAPGIDRELPRQDVVDHLAPLAEGGLDEAPQAVLVLGRQAIVGVERLHDDDRRLDGGFGLEGVRRDAEGDPDPGVVLHEDRQVAHLPGRRGDPFGDLALDHQHERGRAAAPRRAARAGSGEVMWYGRFATTSYGGGTRCSEVLVERVALDERGLPVSSAGSNRSRRKAASPRSSSTAVTCAPDASRPPVSRPSPGPISRTRSPGLGAASAQDRVQDVRVGQEVLREGVAGAQAGGPQRGAHVGRVDPRVRALGRGTHRAASGSDGRASRSRPARSPAANRRAPAAPIIAPLSVHRPGRGTIERHAQGLGLVRQSSPQDAVRGDAAAQDDGAGTDRARRPGRLGREDVDDRVLEAPGELGDGRRRRAARRGRRRPGPPPGAPRPTTLRAAVLRPEKLQSYVSPIHARGKRTSWRTAPSAAAWIAGPPGIAQTQQPPDLVERLARGVVDGRPEQPVREVVAHLGEERVAAAARRARRAGRWARAGGRVLPGVQQPAGVDVALEVVDRDERRVVDPGEGLREVDPDQERAGQARTVRDGDRRRCPTT